MVAGRALQRSGCPGSTVAQGLHADPCELNEQPFAKAFAQRNLIGWPGWGRAVRLLQELHVVLVRLVGLDVALCEALPQLLQHATAAPPRPKAKVHANLNQQTSGKIFFGGSARPRHVSRHHPVGLLAHPGGVGIGRAAILTPSRRCFLPMSALPLFLSSVRLPPPRAAEQSRVDSPEPLVVHGRVVPGLVHLLPHVLDEQAGRVLGDELRVDVRVEHLLLEGLRGSVRGRAELNLMLHLAHVEPFHLRQGQEEGSGVGYIMKKEGQRGGGRGRMGWQRGGESRRKKGSGSARGVRGAGSGCGGRQRVSAREEERTASGGWSGGGGGPRVRGCRGRRLLFWAGHRDVVLFPTHGRRGSGAPEVRQGALVAGRRGIS
eukprot:scaffold8421_cov114-Isochrysis_galbana.AAC.14